jgi:hypothetical protein
MKISFVSCCITLLFLAADASADELKGSDPTTSRATEIPIESETAAKALLERCSELWNASGIRLTSFMSSKTEHFMAGSKREIILCKHILTDLRWAE